MAWTNRNQRTDEPSGNYCRACSDTLADGICAYHAQQFDKRIATTRKRAGMAPLGTTYEQLYGTQEAELNEETSDSWHWCEICESNVPPSHSH